MSVVLIVNHHESACGVHLYGRVTHSLLLASRYHDFVYAECASPEELEEDIFDYTPQAIVYNYYHDAPTLWLTPETTAWVKAEGIRQAAIRHEPTLPMPQNIDLMIDQNPDFIEYPGAMKVLRPIPIDTLPMPEPPEIFTVGSWGFSGGYKGYGTLACQLAREFDRAILRLHIPHATYGDVNGDGARAWRKHLEGLVHDGITIEFSHDWLTLYEFQNWLSLNSMLALCVDPVHTMQRGTSSAIDHALAMRLPLAITDSQMYRHLWERAPGCVIDFAKRTPLTEIYNAGPELLDPVRDEWSNENFVASWERVISCLIS
jgi:hypothetical protein